MDTDLTLQDLLTLLRRRAWVVGSVFAAVVVTALVYSVLQTPLYRSSARVLVNQNSASEIFDPVTWVSSSARIAENEVQLVGSELVADEASSRLGYRGAVRVTSDVRSDVIVVSAENADPARAQAIAQTYAESYIDVRLSQYVGERLDTAEKLLAQITEVDQELAVAAVAADVARLQGLRADLADSFDRLRISADLADGSSAQIIDNAQLPSAPSVPRTKRNLAVGGLLGLILAVGAALLFDTLDRSVKTRVALQRATPGVPVLAIIPSLESPDQIVALHNPAGAEAEAFRSLRAALEFAAVDREIRVIQITSASASVGKTTVAANLAVAMAQSGHNVAVVDADLRRPRLHWVFATRQAPGLTSLILGHESFAGTSARLDLGNGALNVIPSGPVPPGPSELLGSERARRTFAQLREAADIVIVDCPPVLPVADALVLSRYVDATLLVANARLTKSDALESALEQLRQAGAPVVGTVLNQVSKRTPYGYYYGYGGGTDGPAGGLLKRRGVFTQEGDPTPRLDTSELPRFEAARPSAASTKNMSNDVAVNGDRASQPAPAALPQHEWLEPPLDGAVARGLALRASDRAARNLLEASTAGESPGSEDKWGDQVVIRPSDS